MAKKKLSAAALEVKRLQRFYRRHRFGMYGQAVSWLLVEALDLKLAPVKPPRGKVWDPAYHPPRAYASSKNGLKIVPAGKKGSDGKDI